MRLQQFAGRCGAVPRAELVTATDGMRLERLSAVFHAGFRLSLLGRAVHGGVSLLSVYLAGLPRAERNTPACRMSDRFSAPVG